MKPIALIPMRADSKRIPNKHYLAIAGRSPAVRAVGAAVGCKRFEKVYVATNDPVVRDQLKGHTVEFFTRSEKNASPAARTEEVVKEFLEKIECDTLVLIQATNPFHKAFHFDRALDAFKKKRARSLISGVTLHRYLYAKGFARPSGIVPLNKETLDRAGLSNTKPLFVENGAFYIFRAADFLRTGEFLNGLTVGYDMTFETLIELDEP